MSNMSGDNKAKTASTRASNIAAERAKRNNFVLNWGILILFAFGFVYMLDINDYIIKFIAGGIVVIWNGIGDTFFDEYTKLVFGTLAAYIRTGFLFIFLAVAGTTWYTNKQNL